MAGEHARCVATNLNAPHTKKQVCSAPECEASTGNSKTCPCQGVSDFCTYPSDNGGQAGFEDEDCEAGDDGKGAQCQGVCVCVALFVC